MTAESQWEECTNRMQEFFDRLEEIEGLLEASDSDESSWRQWAENRNRSTLKSEGQEFAARLSILSRDFYYLTRILQKKSYLIATACRDALQSRNALA